MCGIIGIFGDNDPKKRVHQSLEKVIHRGGNTFELKYFNNGAIGANRLPIVDREYGRQPKSNEDETIFVVLNGEIFNYKILKKELLSLGHKFKTDSDTEILAHLYEEYGQEMVRKLDSEMFAFIVYDRGNQSVFAARDPLGIKPLYYTHDKTGQLYLGSELKQICFFDDIERVYSFPPGSYFYNGKFKKYFKLKYSNQLTDENKIVNLLEKQIVEAVAKRVDTDLPIGVFLSGGVDSSLIMEIATRLHPDVTAIILGYPGSSDYEFALRLCRERKYKYHVVRPDIDYDQEIDKIVYYLETWEPLIIRQSFASDICAREAQRLGLRVILVGEGSDELFGGYNEFSNLPPKMINQGCLLLTESLNLGHLLRVDRMSMKHTVEVRCPFFDKKIIETAFKIDGNLKVKKENHQITTKYIIRKLATNFLPDYTAWRYKVPIANGAGMNVGSNFKSEDGDVAKLISSKPEAKLSSTLLKKFSPNTREEKYYLQRFEHYQYNKLHASEKRLVVKDNLNDLYRSKKTRFLVGEFDRLALYFPVYLAAEKNIFGLHNLEIDFIATGGDDKTYASLVNNSAHIGLSDPMFAMFENKQGVKGEIIGEIVKCIPVVAVTINPAVKVTKLEDFAKYRIGSFQEYSTTNVLAKYLLPKDIIISPFDHQQITTKLVDRTIDIAIVLTEQAIDLEAVGGKIVHDFRKSFPEFLFTGFTIANILEPKYKKYLKSFVVAAREATRYIYKNKEEALKSFIKLFPTLKEPERVFNEYLKVWSTNIKVGRNDYKNAHTVWKQNYPDLLKNYLIFFSQTSPADSIIEKINRGEFRRDYPFLEDKMQEAILDSLNNKKPLKLFGFWGASNKTIINTDDQQTIAHFKKYIDEINSELPSGVETTWILADEHGKNNGYSEKYYKKYLSSINKILVNNGFKTVYLSTLWKKRGISHQTIESQLQNKKKLWWNDINISKQLEEQAKERFLGKDSILGAQKYYIMRKLEKKFLEKEFAGQIFFTFSDGQLQSIYPKLPTIYLYTQKRNMSDLPWFKRK